MNILVVVDMQNDFITGVLGTKEAKAIVPYCAEKIRNFEGTVVYTMDTHTKDYLDTLEGEKLPILHCVKGTEGWELDGAIKEALEEKNAIGFEKPGFGSIDLAHYLAKQWDVEAIEFIGLCTDICVITNALIAKAVLPQTPIRVDTRGCAGVSVESHERALEQMKMCQIDCL